MNLKTRKWGQVHTLMGPVGNSKEYLLKEGIRFGKKNM